MVERLIAANHSDPWSYTPTQAVAYGFLAERRHARAGGDAYMIQRNAIAAAFGALKEQDEKAFIASLSPED